MKHILYPLFGAMLTSFIHLTALADEKKLTFLHVNDVYELQPRNGLGGVAALGTLLRDYRQRDPQLVFTFGGDLLSPSSLSGLVRGKQMIEAMNGLGMMVAVPGNHEFDFGLENMIARLRESHAVWLASNMTLENGESVPGTRRQLMREMHGVKVGFFGLITPHTASTSKPGKRVRFEPVMEAARREVAELKAQGARVIVALTHLPLAEDRELAATVQGIDLILGGHDHDPAALYEQGVLILKSGSDNQFLGVAELTAVEEKTRNALRWHPSWQVRPVVGVEPDPAMNRLVERWQKTLDEALGAPLLTVATPFTTLEGEVRTRENVFANLLTDVMREALEADVALFNGGGLRGNRVYPEGYLFSARDILTELPFGNVGVLLEVSGQELLTTLENALSQAEGPSGRFPQVAGMRVVYDPEQPPGGRVREVRVGEAPLEPQRRYRVATTDYLASGKEGYDALAKGKVLIDASGATLVTNQLKEWLLAHKHWTPRLEGRVTRLKK
ncbi:MAG: bifunctional metallophosphatase/5'-nucleotidase [Magnetococcales bacterium]|nr:bifunctional metallophosphatase/5'-nucleotidase [Magnetococcales bacterium]